MAEEEPVLPHHGGYRNLKSFQIARLVYDLTVRFCDKYVARGSRTHDQMVQAARSGSQNIGEGSDGSATGRDFEMRLTNVARSSLGELGRDYEDILRQRGLALWEREDPRRVELIERRPQSVDDVARWARDVRAGRCGDGAGPAGAGAAAAPRYLEIVANGILALIAVARGLLRRQLAAQGEAFRREGGFKERLYRIRCRSRQEGEGRQGGQHPQGT